MTSGRKLALWFYSHSAVTRTGDKWQTNVSVPMCVAWRSRFYNSEMMHNNYLLPVRPDTGRNIQPAYDQTSGTLPVSGTDNFQGIVKFEVSARAWLRFCLSVSLPV